jgi:hypothetical protein
MPSPDLFVHARELLIEANRFDATKAGTNRHPREASGVTLEGLLGPPVAERPSAPALRLLEPHALATVTNIAWLEEYDPRLLPAILKMSAARLRTSTGYCKVIVRPVRLGSGSRLSVLTVERRRGRALISIQTYGARQSFSL